MHKEAMMTPSPLDASLRPQGRLWLGIAVGFFTLVGVVWLTYWLFIGRFFVYTDDAYIRGNQVPLTAQVRAGVKAIAVEDTDFVKEGQLLVELDDSDYQMVFEENKEKLASVVRRVAALFEEVGSRRAEEKLRRVELEQAELVYLPSAEPQFLQTVYEHDDYPYQAALARLSHPLSAYSHTLRGEYASRSRVAVARASLRVAERERERAEALVAGTTVETHPLVREQVWKLRESYLNVIRCHILAPATGFVAKRRVQVGNQVHPGEVLLYLVPLDEIWLEANYKETQIRHVRIDQPVSYTTDMYGGEVVFHGRVVGFQPGTGSAFALLPVENGSGNWIKILQRVPIRIAISPKEAKAHPLFLGLSTRVRIDIQERGGKVLAPLPTQGPLYTTKVYTWQREEVRAVDSLSRSIIQDNDYTSSSALPSVESEEGTSEEKSPSVTREEEGVGGEGLVWCA